MEVWVAVVDKVADVDVLERMELAEVKAIVLDKVELAVGVDMLDELEAVLDAMVELDEEFDARTLTVPSIPC